ncbi:MAG: AAA family ATPase [Methylotenera sp.]|uniref:AAA family ATPase n=1 Tax=Methylotenera sp. TaxID=2051956 RepID=UPI0024882EB8|nr:AAA family ATPase [Methylotenera sp.]MDI1308213.1 AAA family ATPase [Methylotenera sp.]
MYYPHFGLKEPPFKITPNTDFFFSGGNRGAVLDALVYAITNGEGIIKVVGEVGSGKTMLCRMLQTKLPEKIESIYLANPSVAPEDVLHAIAFELQLKVPKNADRLKVMQLLQAHLLNRHAEDRQVVIFVEEAQGMPLATLEEIRLLSNLETKQDKLLQIVLFGQPELEVNLSKTHIRQLRERITHSFHLEPLGTKEIGEYLISRLRAAGYHGPHLFTEAAIKKLSCSAEGLVRRVNILADKSLLAAYADNVYQVTPKHVKAAIQDSEFGRRATDYKQYFIGASLLIGILVIATGYAWWQYQLQQKFSAADHLVVATQSKIAAPVATVSTPVVSSITAPSSDIVIVEPLAATTIASAPVLAMPVNMTEIKTLVDRRLNMTRNHLLSASPNTITLQIKSLLTDAKLGGEQKKDDLLKAELQRISQQLEIDNIYLYRKTQNGETYTVILYGEFAERDEALAALKNLPSPIKNNKPYLRTFAGIIRDIDQTQ